MIQFFLGVLKEIIMIFVPRMRDYSHLDIFDANNDLPDTTQSGSDSPNRS